MTLSSGLPVLLLGILWTAGPRQTAPAGRDVGEATAKPSAAAARLPARWWRDAVIAAEVGLTDSQADQINAIFENFVKPQRERWSDFRPLEKELNDLLGQAHADETQVIGLITRLEDKRSELNRHRLIMVFRIQQILNPTQRAKLQQLGWSAPTASLPVRQPSPR